MYNNDTEIEVGPSHQRKFNQRHLLGKLPKGIFSLILMMLVMMLMMMMMLTAVVVCKFAPPAQTLKSILQNYPAHLDPIFLFDTFASNAHR